MPNRGNTLWLRLAALGAAVLVALACGALAPPKSPEDALMRAIELRDKGEWGALWDMCDSDFHSYMDLTGGLGGFAELGAPAGSSGREAFLRVGASVEADRAERAERGDLTEPPRIIEVDERARDATIKLWRAGEYYSVVLVKEDADGQASATGAWKVPCGKL